MIRAAEQSDLESLAKLRHQLWPEDTVSEHQRELSRYFSGDAREPLQILVAVAPDDILVAFCELSIRAYAESCHSDRVGYLEGWFVSHSHRHQGIGGSLIAAAEDWARSQGCTEFASDAEADNAVSIEAHKALGFEDAGLIRCFRKDL